MHTLVKFNKNDIPQFINELRNTDSRFLIQFAGKGYRYPITFDQVNENLEDENYLLFKFISDSGQIIGYCQLTRINWIEKCCSIGRVLINDNFKGHGYSYLMLEQLILHARNDLKFKKLSLRVFDFNIPARKCYTKLGFTIIKSENAYFENIDETWECITMERELN